MPLAPPPPPLRLLARPALAGAVAFGLGIVAAHLAPEAPQRAWLGAVGACGAVAALYAWRVRRRLVTLRPLAMGAAALVAVFALGAGRMAAWSTLPADHIAHAARVAQEAEDADITLWGTVEGEPEARASGVRLVLRADSAWRDGRGQAVRGEVQVTLAIPGPSPWGGEAPPAPVFPALRTGDRIAVAGMLGVARGKRNPADFDYRAFLAQRGIHATLYAQGAESVAFLAPSGWLPTRFANALRQRIRRALGAHVAAPEARGVLGALLLADRSGIAEDTREAFVQAGLVHLLAVSGLHVLLVGFVLYGIMGPVLGRLGVGWGAREWSRSLFTFGLLAVYVLLTGAAIPVVRAWVMASVVLLGRALEKPFDTLNTLGMAALVLLMVRPGALFEVGFQLSFSAVAALATLTPLAMRAVRRVIPERVLARGGLAKWASEMTVASGAATLGTAPVLLVYFGRVPLAGLVLNLAAIPLTAAALGAGLLTALAAPIAPLADVLGAVAGAAAQGLLWTSEIGARGLGLFSVERFVTDGPLIAAMAAGIGALALWLRPRVRWRLALFALGLVVLTGLGSAARGDGDAALDVVFLDVGQGDATLLAFPGGRHVLIDAGPATPRWDSGARTVLPHLARYGIRRLDLVIATHPDADHTGGLPAVLKGVEIGRLVHNGDTREDGPWAETLRLADSLGIAQQIVASGDTLSLAPEARIRVLAPGPDALASGDANEGSVALLVQFGTTDFLLDGRRRDGIRGRNAHLVRASASRRGRQGGTPRLAHVVHARIRARRGRQRISASGARGVGGRSRSPARGIWRHALGRRERRRAQPLRPAGRGAAGAVGRQRRRGALDRRERRSLVALRWHNGAPHRLALTPEAAAQTIWRDRNLAPGASGGRCARGRSPEHRPRVRATYLHGICLSEALPARLYSDTRSA